MSSHLYIHKLSKNEDSIGVNLKNNLLTKDEYFYFTDSEGDSVESELVDEGFKTVKEVDSIQGPFFTEGTPTEEDIESVTTRAELISMFFDGDYGQEEVADYFFSTIQDIIKSDWKEGEDDELIIGEEEGYYTLRMKEIIKMYKIWYG